MCGQTGRMTTALNGYKVLFLLGAIVLLAACSKSESSKPLILSRYMGSRAIPNQLEVSDVMTQEPKETISPCRKFMRNLVRGKS